MDIISLAKRKISNRRDIINFMTIRDATEDDDRSLGEFLISIFSEVNQRKIGLTMNEKRRKELSQTKERRNHAVVRILEFNSKIIGSYTLSSPGSPYNLSWCPLSCYFSTFALHQNFHGMGLGSMLILDARTKALDQMIPSMMILVEKTAHKLHEFYLNHGFYYDPAGDCEHVGMDLIGMKADLTLTTSDDLLKAI